jgi:hypothetical protein
MVGVTPGTGACVQRRRDTQAPKFAGNGLGDETGTLARRNLQTQIVLKVFRSGWTERKMSKNWAPSGLDGAVLAALS